MDSQNDPAIPAIHRNDHSGGLFTKKTHHDTYDFISPTKTDLTGRVVLITGASRGIGRTMAVSFTKARASFLCLAARGDFSTTVSAIEQAAKASSLPIPDILLLQVDISSATSVDTAAATVRSRFPGGIDIVVNNAGYLEPEVFVAESDPTEWSRSIDINLKGPYLMGRAFIPQLVAKEGGLKVLCNIISIGGLLILPGMSAYNIAKFATCRLAEYEDAEYGERGLITFVLHPGGVRTDMGLALPKEKHHLLTDTAELVSDTTVWLTRERREWLRGRYFSVQWDMEELLGKAQDIMKKDLLKNKLQVA